MSTLASFGAIGDGIVDDRQALINFIAGDGDSIEAGTFRISNIVDVSNKLNRSFTGEGKDLTTIVSDTVICIRFLNKCSNLTFTDIHFTSSFLGITDNVYGSVTFGNATLLNITFIRCRFSAPLSKGNALKIVQELAISSNIRFIECEFIDSLRMGLEIQNHTSDSVDRCTNIVVDSCLVKNCRYGMSFSGFMSGFSVINNIFDDIKLLAIEGIGVNNSVFDTNTFQNFVENYYPVSFTNTRLMTGNVISNNVEINPEHKLVEWTLRTSVYMKFTGNVIDGGFVYLTNVNNSYFSENDIKSKGVYALMLEQSANNLIESNEISNQGVANYATIRCYGNRSVNNKFIGNRVKAGIGGSYFDQINGATGNIGKYNYVGTVCRTSSLQSGTSASNDRLKFNNIIADYIIDCPSTTDFTSLTDQAKWDFKFSNVEYPASMMLYTKVVNNRMLVHFRLTQFLTLKQLIRLISVYGLDWIPIWIRSRDTLTENLAIDKSKIIPYWRTTKTLQDTIYIPMYYGVEPIKL
jgi:hypothetical protein